MYVYFCVCSCVFVCCAEEVTWSPKFHPFLVFLIRCLCAAARLWCTDICKHTPTSYRDYQSLKDSLEKVGEIADFINQKKRESDEFQVLCGSLRLCMCRQSLCVGRYPGLTCTSPTPPLPPLYETVAGPATSEEIPKLEGLLSPFHQFLADGMVPTSSKLDWLLSLSPAVPHSTTPQATKA